LEIGQGYRIYSSGKLYDRMKSKMFEDIRKQVDEFNSDVLYIESIIGTFSLSDLYPFTHEIKQKEPLIFLELKQEQIRNIINNSYNKDSQNFDYACYMLYYRYKYISRW